MGKLGKGRLPAAGSVVVPGMAHPLMLLRFLTCTKTVQEAEEMVLTAQAVCLGSFVMCAFFV